MKLICGALAILLALSGVEGLAQQDKNANPGLHYDKQAGFSVNLPPKNDEWAFREKEKGGESPAGAILKDAKLCVAHKVDEVVIEIHMFPQAVTDLKKQIETDWSFFSGSPVFKDPKQVAIQQSAKLPGNGAGGANAKYLELTCSKADRPFEIREWLFIGRENQFTYQVLVHGDAGTYKKHQKAADFILATFRTWKIPKN